MHARVARAGAEKMKLQLKPIQAAHARDALVKQLYARIFDHLVHCINDALASGQPHSSTIGLLDVFGFESFKRNSFEQLCINYANERLHAFFMEQVPARGDWPRWHPQDPIWATEDHTSVHLFIFASVLTAAYLSPMPI